MNPKQWERVCICVCVCATVAAGRLSWRRRQEGRRARARPHPAVAMVREGGRRRVKGEWIIIQRAALTQCPHHRLINAAGPPAHIRRETTPPLAVFLRAAGERPPSLTCLHIQRLHIQRRWIWRRSFEERTKINGEEGHTLCLLFFFFF